MSTDNKQRGHDADLVGGSAPRHLVEGFEHFHNQVFPLHREAWNRLASQQHPSTLFITCADSRVDPGLITQARPGELFVCRNPGNLVPPYGVEDGGVATTAEYAIDILNVRHAIICGHSNCGAMRGLLDPASVSDLATIAGWLRYAAKAKRLADVAHPSSQDPLRTLTEENVLAQMMNLRTYPAVAAALATGTLTLHGWYFDIGHGMLYGWSEFTRRFESLIDAPDAHPGPEHLHAL